MTDTDQRRAYYDRALYGAFRGVIDADPAEGTGGGFVDSEMAIDALCRVVAIIAGSSDYAPTAKQRRDVADRCRKQILEESNKFARQREAGEPPPWPVGAAEPVAIN